MSLAERRAANWPYIQTHGTRGDRRGGNQIEFPRDLSTCSGAGCDLNQLLTEAL